MSEGKDSGSDKTADNDNEQDTDRSDAQQEKASSEANSPPDEDNNDDVIHVAQTPTNAALLTQLEHNRLDSETRGLGAGHTGSAIFHMQRLTALALIPLGIWFVVGIIRMALGASTGTRADAAAWLSDPVKAVLMALFIVIGLRHAVIGLRIVLEDYVRNSVWHRACLLGVQAIAWLIGTASIAALIHLAL